MEWRWKKPEDRKVLLAAASAGRNVQSERHEQKCRSLAPIFQAAYNDDPNTSSRKMGAILAEQGHLNRNNQPYGSKSVLFMKKTMVRLELLPSPETT